MQQLVDQFLVPPQTALFFYMSSKWVLIRKPGPAAEPLKWPQVLPITREEWLQTHFPLHHGNLPVCWSHWTILMQLQALTFSSPLQ